MNTSTNTAAVLESSSGKAIALQGVQIDVRLHDLMSEVSVTQQYLNHESVNIEAVYTFPLPLDAVLLEMTVKLDGRELRGKIVEKTEAEEAYEEAITDGDTAIMLQQTQPGLYSMNLGNLQAGESASICFRYAMLLRWSGDQVRLMLPTVIAPRYGDAQAAGLEPQQQPEYSLDAEYDYGLRIEATGLLANADIQSPTHDVLVQQTGQGASIVLSHQVAQLDRDFVLNFDNPAAGKNSAILEQDLQGYVALASFRPDFGIEEDRSARNIKVVVDCSGSMMGASIAQAKEALLRILDSLRPQDQFGLIAYGSHPVSLFKKQKRADELNLHKARNFVRQLDADMGGTETEEALDKAYRLNGHAETQPDVLLITDGQIWGGEFAVKAAKKAGHRLFTVGVGNAAAEGVVRELAEKTGGAYELVTPSENMADRIHRHFQRIYSPRASHVEIKWPGEHQRVYPKKFKTVYEGDTLHAYAWFKQPVEGEVRLSYSLPDGQAGQARAVIQAMRADKAGQHDKCQTGVRSLARMATASRIGKVKDPQRATALAVDYQLMSKYTHCLVIDTRQAGDQAEDLPELRVVPQMISLLNEFSPREMSVNYSMSRPLKCNQTRSNGILNFPEALSETVHSLYSAYESFNDDMSSMDLLDTSDRDAAGFIDQVAWLNNLDIDLFIPSLKINTLDALQLEHVIEEMQALLNDNLDEASLVVLFLYYIAQSDNATELDRNKRRSISKAFKALSKSQRARLGERPEQYEFDAYEFVDLIELTFDLRMAGVEF